MLTDRELPPLPEFSGAATPVLRAALQSIARDYGRAVEKAAYEAAIKVCRKELLGTNPNDHESDRAHDSACNDCIKGIEKLMMQEQPK